MATTYLQHPPAVEIRLAGSAMIQLNAISVIFVAGREWKVHGRIFFIAVVEENNFVGFKPAGHVSVSEFLAILNELLIQLPRETFA